MLEGYSLSSQKGHNLTIKRLADESFYVVFPGFLTSYNDSYQSNYNSEMVYGRNDPILTFQGTERTIEVGLRVAGVDRISMISNQTKLSGLIKMLYPGYRDEIMVTPPLVRVSYANYIPDLPCAITSFNYNPVFDDTNGWIDASGGIAPTYFDLSLNLSIIHDFELGFDESTSAPGAGWIRDDLGRFGYGEDTSDGLTEIREYDQFANAMAAARAAALAAIEEAAAAEERRLQALDPRALRQERRRARRASRDPGNSDHARGVMQNRVAEITSDLRARRRG